MGASGSGTRDTALAPQRSVRRGIPLVLCGMLLTSLISMLDQAIVATAAPSIAGDLGGLDGYAWLFTGYMLSFSATMPLYGKLGDLFGRKPVYLFAIVVFLLGSAACGAAQSMEQLIAFRVLQGLGGGGLVVGAMAILGEILDGRSRARYQGYLAAVFAFANLAGPVVGGVITDQLGWRWAFYVNLPTGLLALAIAVRHLHTAKPQGRPRIDYPGAALLTIAMVSTVLIASWAGTEYAWSSPVILWLGAAAVLALIAFVLVERVAPEPILPLRLFRDSTLDISIVVAFVGSFAFFGLISFVPLFFQLVSGVSASQTGLLFVPAMLATAVAAMLTGQMIARTGRYKWFMVASMGGALVGMYPLTTVSADTRPWVAAGYLTVVGFAMGLSQHAVTLAAQNTAPPKDLGVVTSTVGLLRNSGVWFGTAVFGAILNARLVGELADRLPADQMVGIDPGAMSPDRVGELAPAVQRGFAEAYAAALATGFEFVLPLLVAGLVAALLLKDLPLRPRPLGAGGGGPRPTPAAVEPATSGGADDRR